jgi:hypothetical protein
MSYDPKKKHAGHHGFRAVIKVAVVLILCCLVVLVMRMNQGDEIVAHTEAKVKKGAVALPQDKERLDQLGKKVSGATSDAAAAASTHETKETTTNNKFKGTMGDEADRGTMKDEEDPEALPDLPFDDDRPIFVLSLPQNGDLAISRYFECGGVNKVGRYWTHSDPTDSDRRPLGQCLQSNLKENSGINQGCGRFSVWTELQFIHPPIDNGPDSRGPQCFDPVLFPGALEALYQAYPEALIVTVERKHYPQIWLDHLPKDLKTYWKKWCNPSHNNTFPNSSKSTASADAKFVKFYQGYYTKVQAFIDSHEGWGHVAINWDEDVSVTASQLEEALKLPAKCWKEAVEGEMVDDAGSARRPSEINFPVIIASLPYSGGEATHNYFECGLGSWSAASQWTALSEVPLGSPPNSAIGQCLERNFIKEKRNDVFKGCGYARVWSDIGYLRDTENNGTCYYPILDDSFLTAFAKYYPHATILHVVRDAEKWYNTAVTKGNLPNRWNRAQHCDGFPTGGEAEWLDFYHHYTNRIRSFAAANANMTYMEIPVSEAGGQHLQSIFTYHPKCWKIPPSEA